MTDSRIQECKDMINILKSSAKSVAAVKHRTVIRNVSLASYLFVLDETLAVLNSLEAENKSLKKENSILNNAIASNNIDFPNSAVRSSDLYDPVDKLF